MKKQLPLTSLPVGVLSHLAGFLDLKYFVRLHGTCKTIREALRSCSYVSKGVALRSRSIVIKGVVRFSGGDHFERFVRFLRRHPKMVVPSLDMPIHKTSPVLNQLMDHISPTLKTLYIYIGQETIFTDDTDAKALAVLQGKRFPKLKTFWLGCSELLRRSDQFACLLSGYLDHLSKTSPNLEYLDMHVRTNQDRVTLIAQKFKNLKRLELMRPSEETWSADAALFVFGAHKQLQEIDLVQATITKEGLQALSRCPMQRLNLYRCRGFDDEALASFLVEANYLEYLNARDTSIGSKSLKALAQHKKLEELVISECQHIDDKAATEIAKLPLKQLDMRSSNVSNHMIYKLVDRGETSLACNLEKLILHDNRDVTDTGAECIVSSCRKLKYLGVCETGVEHLEPYWDIKPYR